MDHVIGHAHDHDHSHGHDHSHDHHYHETEYYTEQLLSIFISGAFGVTGVLMYHYDMLQYILANMFHIPVLVGGIGLLGLTFFRGFCLWKQVGSDHDDEHAGHDHGPGEACCEDDGHSHGNMYWRIVVLAFPVLLFLMGLPNGTFGKDYIAKLVGKDAKSLGAFASVAEKEGDEASYSFADLNSAAYTPERRAALAGTKASVKGQIARISGSQREFMLFHLKMTCCQADIVPLKARIVTESQPVADVLASKFKDQAWVEVHGVLQFVEVGKNNFVVVLVIKQATDVNDTQPVRE